MCCTTVFDWLVQIFFDEDNELQETEVENVSALQGAFEDDMVANGSDNGDTSGSDMSDDESDAEEA